MKKIIILFAILFGWQGAYAAYTCQISYTSCKPGYLAVCNAAGTTLKEGDCGGGTVYNCILDDGYKRGTLGVIDLCPAGYFCTDLVENATPCQGGYFCPQGSTTQRGRPIVAATGCAVGADCICNSAYFCPAKSTTAQGSPIVAATGCGADGKSDCPCPAGFLANTTQKSLQTQCRADCPMGYIVQTANSGGCATPQNSPNNGDWYTLRAHSVFYGSASQLGAGLDYMYCAATYGINSNVPSAHDAITDCGITCMPGTYLKTANDASCTVCPVGQYKITQTNIGQGQSETCLTCPSGTTQGIPFSYDDNLVQTAAERNELSDCKLDCAAGTMVLFVGQGCATYTSSYVNTTPGHEDYQSWYTYAHTVKYNSTTKDMGALKKCINNNFVTLTDATITSHDNFDDCRLSCTAQQYVPKTDATAQCEPIQDGYYRLPLTTTQYTIAPSGVRQNSDTTTIAMPQFDCADLPGEDPDLVEGAVPSHGLPINTTTGGYTSVEGSRNSKTSCRYMARNKTMNGCASVVTIYAAFTGTAYERSRYTVNSLPGYLISSNNSPEASCPACPAGFYNSDPLSTSCGTNLCDSGYYCPSTSTSGHGKPYIAAATCAKNAECPCADGWYCPPGSTVREGFPVTLLASNPNYATFNAELNAAGCASGTECLCPSRTRSTPTQNKRAEDCFIVTTASKFIDGNNSVTGLTLNQLLGAVTGNMCYFNFDPN